MALKSVNCCGKACLTLNPKRFRDLHTLQSLAVIGGINQSYLHLPGYSELYPESKPTQHEAIVRLNGRKNFVVLNLPQIHTIFILLNFYSCQK